MRGLDAVILAMLAAGCAGRAAPPDVASGTVELPSTPAGSALTAWLEAYNTGDSVRIAATLARLYTAEALVRRSAAERAGGVMGWRSEYGGFELARIDSVQNAMVVVTVRESLTRGFGMLFVEVDSARPAKVTGVSLIPFVEPPDWPSVERAGSEGALAERVSGLAEQLAATGAFRGVVLLTRGDRVLLHRGYGIAADSSFELASVSKMFTAVGTLQLVEQGRLSTDATIGEVLPAYPPGPSATQVTIQHLLTMAAGIPDLFRSPRYRGRQDQFRTLRDH